MRKLYSLFAALIVAVFALAQTTPTVTTELVGGKAIVTPTPSDAQVVAPVCDGGGEGGGEGETTLTFEAGKYYVSTFMDETTQYLLTTTTGTAVVLPATLYADANTPTAAHEFDFVAVEGQNACFTIQDNTNAFLAVKSVRGLGGMSTQFTLEATKPETGAVWKVTVQDALNHVSIENTDYAGDLHCLNLEGEIAYCFGTEATGSYKLPILIKVPGVSTNIQEADIDRQVIKTIENGQLILNINGVRYNILGIAL